MEENKEVMEDQKDLNQDETKTTYTKEEVQAKIEAATKEFQSNSEKGVQKVISEKKNYETAMFEIGKVADNKEHLVELYEDNPEVAKIILDTIYDGKSIEDFKESIGYKEDMSDPKVVERLIEKKAKQMSDTQKISDAKNNFIKNLGLDGDELKSFENAFAERMELKSFSVNDIDKHLEKAFKEVSDDTEMLKKFKKTKEIAKTMATSNGKNGETSKSVANKNTKDEAADFVKKFIM